MGDVEEMIGELEEDPSVDDEEKGKKASKEAKEEADDMELDLDGAWGSVDRQS